MTDSREKKISVSKKSGKRIFPLVPSSLWYWANLFGNRKTKSVERLFDDSFMLGDVFDKTYCPAMNVEATEAEYVVTMELPGVEKEDFEIILDGNVISVKGAKEEIKEEKDEAGEVFRSERSYGSFERSTYLGEDVDKDGETKAVLEDGVLKISIPRLPPKDKEGVKKIEVK